jgi:inward rectifier potassium channel
MNKPITSEEQNRDLGFGSVVARESRRRLLNRDGTFNVQRNGLSFWDSLSAYHYLLTISWSRFILFLVIAYLLLNALFAMAFMLCGPQALAGGNDQLYSPFLHAFFFSIQTFATIGYGSIAPAGLAANLIVTAESLIGLLSFALATGILFARFSRPTAQILFSRTAVIAPYRGRTAFEFRIANQRKNQIIELEAKVLFSRLEPESGDSTRRFHQLELERNKVVFFPLSWTIVHPIDEKSPLNGLNATDLRAMDAEFLVLLTGIDETFSQTVHARASYKADEVVWNAKFIDIFVYPDGDEPLKIDIGHLHEIEKL